ncbi:hypothetical protein ACQR09_31595 [Bradyrhizobium oligotrophicum]|uniref:hypothetical protein n=1 Tax=Bradyrhizobium oligotrophicum TaxID=44255 RepID=UPI003EBC828B
MRLLSVINRTKGITVTEKEHIREGLLNSIDDTAALLGRLREAAAAAEKVNVAVYRSVQLELTLRNAALVEQHLRIKHAVDFAEAPAREPDYGYWARKHWTIDQAAALAAGREPSSVDWVEPTALLEMLKSAVKDKLLDEEMRPADFVDWFDQLGDDSFLPPKLRQAVVTHRTIFSKSVEKETPQINERDADTQVEADIQAVKGSKKTALEMTNVLLEYFMRSGATVAINPNPNEMAVSYKAAQDLQPELDVTIKDPKTIQKHLDHAVKTVRRLKAGAAKRKLSGGDRK